jgi:hypothetical protein
LLLLLLCSHVELAKAKEDHVLTAFSVSSARANLFPSCFTSLFRLLYNSLNDKNHIYRQIYCDYANASPANFEPSLGVGNEKGEAHDCVTELQKAKLSKKLCSLHTF